MGLLGQFLESFYGNGQHFRTVHAHVRRECTPSRRGETSRRRMIGRQKTPTSQPVTTLADFEFWAMLPNQVRGEATTTKDGNAETRVEITKGDLHPVSWSVRNVRFFNILHFEGEKSADSSPFYRGFFRARRG